MQGSDKAIIIIIAKKIYRSTFSIITFVALLVSLALLTRLKYTNDDATYKKDNKTDKEIC